MNMRPQIVVDLGSRSVKGSSDDRTVTLPSHIIRNVQTGNTVRMGTEGVGSVPELPKKRIYTMRSGKLVDYRAAQRVITEVIDKLVSWWALLRPHVLMATNAQATTAEVRQLKEAARIAGAESVYTARSIVLSAFGAGVEPTSSQGVLMVDIGAGKTEAAVVVRGSQIVGRSISVGGDRLVEDVVDHIEDAYGFTLSESQAHNIIREVGTAVPEDTPPTVPVSDGKQDVVISANDIAAAVRNSLREISDCVHHIMQQSSAALLTDISKSGLFIVGGVARLDHLDTYLSRQLSVSAHVVESPADAVVRGGRIAWSQIIQHPQYPRILQLR